MPSPGALTNPLAKICINNWTVKEKLYLACCIDKMDISSNWRMISEAVNAVAKENKSNRMSDWFSEQNCKIQYQLLLREFASKIYDNEPTDSTDSTLTTALKLVNELREVRLAEIKLEMEKHFTMYHKLKQEIEDIECGKLDDKLDEFELDIIEHDKRKEAKCETLNMASSVKLKEIIHEDPKQVKINGLKIKKIAKKKKTKIDAKQKNVIDLEQTKVLSEEPNQMTDNMVQEEENAPSITSQPATSDTVGINVNNMSPFVKLHDVFAGKDKEALLALYGMPNEKSKTKSTADDLASVKQDSIQQVAVGEKQPDHPNILVDKIASVATSKELSTSQRAENCTTKSMWSTIVEQTTKTCQVLPNMTCISIDLAAGPLPGPESTANVAITPNQDDCLSEMFTFTLLSLVEHTANLAIDNTKCEDPPSSPSSASHNKSLFHFMPEEDTEENQVDIENCDVSPSRSLTSLEEIPIPQNEPDLIGSPVETTLSHLLDHGSYTCTENTDLQKSLRVEISPGTQGGVQDSIKPHDPFMGVSQEYIKSNSFLENFNAASAQMETSAELLVSATSEGDGCLESVSFARVVSQEDNLIPLDATVVQSDCETSVEESFTEKQKEEDDNKVESASHQQQPDDELGEPGLNKKQRKTLVCMLEQFKQLKSSFVIAKLPNPATHLHYFKVLKRPMDLCSIKKRLENGSIESLEEFQRDLRLMFTNAILYYHADAIRLAELSEMQDECFKIFEVNLAAHWNSEAKMQAQSAVPEARQLCNKAELVTVESIAPAACTRGRTNSEASPCKH